MSESAHIKATSYAQRNQIIRALGFQGYKPYIESIRWFTIRNRVIRAARGYCCGCHGMASEVHHEWYSWHNLTGDSLEGLRPLCRKCHGLIETVNGEKILDLREVDRRLGVLLKGGYQEALKCLGAVPEPERPVNRGPETGMVRQCQPVNPEHVQRPKFVSRQALTPAERALHVHRCAKAGRESARKRKP